MSRPTTGRPSLPATQQETLAAQRLWQLADAYRTQLATAQAQHLREFAANAEEVLRRTGDLVLLDEPEDMLVLRADGRFETSLDLSDRPDEVVASAEPRRPGLTVTEAQHDRRVLRPRGRPALGDRGARRALSGGRLLRRLRMTDASLRDASVESLFARSGALLDGHFLLKSGRHAGRYLEKFLVLQHPRVWRRAVPPLRRGAGSPYAPTLVVGPTTGGVLLSFETARQLGGIGARGVRRAVGWRGAGASPRLAGRAPTSGS